MVYNNNASLSTIITQGMDFYPYSWCKNYPTGPVIWATVAVTSFLLGFPASLWVLHELIQRQRKRSTTEFYMPSLSVIDLLFTAQLPISVCNFMLWRIQKVQDVLILINSLSISGRPLFMAGICWDCYMAVVYPIIYKTSAKMILIKKVVMLTICFFTLIGGLIICNMPWLITTPYTASPLILALPVITFCDISILRALKKPDPTGNVNIHPQKKQALYTISTSFIMTFLVYLPPMIIFLFGKLLLLGEIETFCCLAPYGFIFSTAGCAIMPVLYLIRVGKLDKFKKWWKV